VSDDRTHDQRVEDHRKHMEAETEVGHRLPEEETIYAVGYDMGDTVDVLALYLRRVHAEAHAQAECQDSSATVVPMLVRESYEPPE
jgi:hypothetical protein